MIAPQTGPQPTPEILLRLSVQLRKVTGQYDLDTAEMVELTAWASTATVNPLQSFARQQATLMNGLKELPLITGDRILHAQVIGAILQSVPDVRYGGVKMTRGKHESVIVAWRPQAKGE